MTGIIIQARMGSERLRGKILKKLGPLTMIEHVVERASRAKLIDAVVVATTMNDAEQSLIDLLLEKGIKYYRGSENDVLKRYIDAAEFFGIDTVVRVTSDCPLIDPDMIDYVIEQFSKVGAEYSENCRINRTCPRGLDTEVVRLETLKRIYGKDLKPFEKEHVTVHIYENQEEFKILPVSPMNKEINRPDLRLTVDTTEDFELMESIYGKLYRDGNIVDIYEAIKLLDSDKELRAINSKIAQKTVVEGKNY